MYGSELVEPKKVIAAVDDVTRTTTADRSFLKGTRMSGRFRARPPPQDTREQDQHAHGEFHLLGPKKERPFGWLIIRGMIHATAVTLNGPHPTTLLAREVAEGVGNQEGTSVKAVYTYLRYLPTYLPTDRPP